MTEADPMVARLMEEYATAAATRSGLPEPQRTEGRLELVSHLHDVARSRARAENAAEVTQDHARQAIGSVGSGEQVDQAFFAPRRAGIQPAPWGPRIVAYLIDIALAFLVVGVLSVAADQMLAPIFRSADCYLSIDDPVPLVGSSLWCNNTAAWFQAVTAPLPFLWELVQFVLVVYFFVIFESTVGATPGKMAMRLRVTSSEGKTITKRQAWLRNLTKGFPPVAAGDALLGYLASGEKKERISDRLVHTAVFKEVR